MKEAKFYLLNDTCNANLVNASEYGLNHFLNKSNQHIIYIKNLSQTAANILKQDAISVGASVLNNKNAILFNVSKSDSILLVNDENIKALSEKIKLQQFSLKRLQEFLNTIKTTKKYPKIMGIMNINNDSFYESSRISEAEFLNKVYEFIEHNASIIDIGAMSSRPRSCYLGEDEELDRLKGVFKLISEHKLYDKIDFSLDSFSPTCLKLALDTGFKYINDISANTKLSSLAKSYDASYILMHSKNNYINNYLYKSGLENNHCDNKFDILDEVYEFFSKKLEQIEGKVIIDIGIGFGKNKYENMVLLKYLEHFKSLNKPILLAGSNKRFFADEKELKSLVAHANTKADIIRVHDVIKQNALINYYKKMDEI